MNRGPHRAEAAAEAQAPVASACSPSAICSVAVGASESSAIRRRAMIAAEADPSTVSATAAIQGRLSRSSSRRSRIVAGSGDCDSRTGQSEDGAVLEPSLGGEEPGGFVHRARREHG